VRKKNPRKYTSKEYLEVIRLHNEGKGYRKISKITGIPINTIGGWISSVRTPRCMWANERRKEIHDKIFTPETRKKLSDANKGKTRTPEQRENYRKAAKKGSKHHLWKGDNAKPEAGYYRARKMYPVPKGYQRHHIDGNPLNNDPNNVKIVKPRQHMIIDGRLDRLIKNSKKRAKRGFIRDEKGRFKGYTNP